MNDGFVNERDIINYLNGKTYVELNDNFKNFVEFIFDSSVIFNEKFIVNNCAGGIKPDISISHNNITKYISIKKGSGNSVHQENIDVFFPFFETVTNNKCLNNLKLFHYGDGTTNDTGKIRYNASQVKPIFEKEIAELNKAINKKDILKIFLDRFLFIGNVSTTSVDYVYHGTLTSGYWASKSEIIHYITNNNFNVNGVHFGPLTYQVWGRNHNRTAKHPDRRYVMQIKWLSILNNLISIRSGV